MKNILFIIGTRPEAIKLAPVIFAFNNNKNFNVKVCVTAQHRDMLDQILKWFDINPDYDLDIMEPHQTLSTLSSKLLKGLNSLFEKEKPDIILIQGDTTTVFIAALVAFYFKIAIGHIEAGLRTFDKYNPFPEEINRKLTSCLANIHFAPTETAKKNLLSEGILPEKIFVVGNTVIDSLLFTIKKLKLVKNGNLPIASKLKRWDQTLKKKKLILVTAHRRENFGKGLENICKSLLKISDRHLDTIIVYPVHPNPCVQKITNKILQNNNRILCTKPLSYIEFVYLLSKSYLILTDSGGIQEEAPSLGKPVLVLRETTERPEAIKANTVKIVGTNEEKIITNTCKLLENEKLYQTMSKAHNPYGDGKTSKRIADIIYKLSTKL